MTFEPYHKQIDSSEVFIKYEVEGKTFGQIAKEMNVSRNTAFYHVNKVRKLIAKRGDK